MRQNMTNQTAKLRSPCSLKNLRGVTGGLLLPALLMVSGCATRKQDSVRDSVVDGWRRTAEAPASLPRGPSVRPAAPLPQPGVPTLPEPQPEPTPGNANGCPLPTTPISLALHNVDVPTLVEAMGKLVDLVVLARRDASEEDDVDQPNGIVSVSADNIPWDELFLGFLKTHGLRHEWTGEKLIRVMTLEEMKRDSDLETFERELAQRKADWAKARQPLQTHVIQTHYLNVGTAEDAAELQKTLTELLTPNPIALLEGGMAGPASKLGMVTVDARNGLVILRAAPDDAGAIREVINTLDQPPCQVLIRAHIVETSRDTARKLGVQWGGLLEMGESWLTPGANAGDILGSGIDTAIAPTAGQAANFPANLGVGATPSALTLGLATQSVGHYILNVQLSALEEDGELTIISEPKITTIDNQTAFIESGREVPYQVVTGVGTDRDTTTEWKKAVLRLEVTPKVIDNTALTLKISTNKDELDFSRATDANPNPIVITKRAETNVTIANGATTIIGGLVKHSTDGANTGVPWLMDVPFLGRLFGSQSRSTSDEEILIFITPIILGPGENTAQDRSQGARGSSALQPATPVGTDQPEGDLK
ncbi:MAG: hypothetical protein HN742_41285 [Lentisphaerae bacterium]|nr:hypothetical protein [Lentisphaerota bacterium]MBT4815450.1 hypothetical protein [Lentisphaerota bacterium]MBT5612723.1 hypothetical protein [Lentisphaerota bacterium]MBT7058952.1 hypothetical protein [Lentisphaerota bacterium]MBT7848372.1 hypothetical protein [Lentisphaerota bacterium]